uniref:Sperm associated antigen 5 n=1 Tax=Amphiprion percula TaxID=161767 RepID=A0A3P8T1N9_AMPPE
SLHVSTPSSRFKSKAQLSTAAVDIPLSNQDPHLHCPSTTDMTTAQTVSGLGDVTFKSFTCAGGEVEIPGSSLCEEESFILPKDQATYNNESEDSVASHSMTVQSCSEHIEHAYHNPEMKESYSVDISAACLTNTTLTSGDRHDKQATEDLRDFQNDCCEEKFVTWKSFVRDMGEVEVSDVTRLQDETIPLPKTEFCEPLQDNSVNLTHFSVDSCQLCHVEHADHPYCSSEKPIVPVINTSSEISSSDNLCNGLSDVTFMSFNCAGGEIEISEGTKSADETASSQESDIFISFFTADGEAEKSDDVKLFRKTSFPLKDQAVDHNSVFTSAAQHHIQDDYKQPNSHLENDEAVADTDPPAITASALEILTPVVRRASQYLLKDCGNPAHNQFLSDDSALEGEKSFLSPVNVNPTGLWADHLDSPIPRPLFNSTALGFKPSADPVTEPVEDLAEKLCAMPQSKIEKPVLDVPLIPNGPLQQQLRQMAEFLLLASGKMGLAGVSASVPAPTAFMALSARTPPAEFHNVCVGTSPVKLVDHSLNTSGLFERKREFTVVDACTVTDPILWNLPPGSLECLPRPELEQRLKTSMIMVEALVQQLGAARAQGCPSAGPAPSDLREKLVQTDHTELSQVRTRTIHLRIEFFHCDDALSLDIIETIILLSKSIASYVVLCDIEASLYVYLVDCLQTFSAMDQLRTHCATEISALEKSVGCQQELLTALNQTYPEQVQKQGKTNSLTVNIFLLLLFLKITSEMSVLRQKLTEKEEETGQLERKATELSATVSSSLASYTFLEQALAAESTKLQQSWKDIQQANMRFLQVENELAREQVAESERLLRENMQGLRERNIECEDLKGELCQLQLENGNLQEELETTRTKASATQLELVEKMAQAVSEITLLHHTLRGLTNELHAALSDQDKERQPVRNMERCHFSSSFVDSIMVALTAEKEEDAETDTRSDTPEPQCDILSSQTSAFTRIAAVTPKKNLNAAKFEPEEEQQSSVAELLADLGSTVTELVGTLKLVQQQYLMCCSSCGLQVEQQAANSRHEAEVLELKGQLSCLNNLVERGNQALQQKAQVKDCLHSTSADLRKDVTELRRALQQSRVESQFLREEMRKTGSQSATPAHYMEEKIQLLKEVGKLVVNICIFSVFILFLIEYVKNKIIYIYIHTHRHYCSKVWGHPDNFMSSMKTLTFIHVLT